MEIDLSQTERALSHERAAKSGVDLIVIGIG